MRSNTIFTTLINNGHRGAEVTVLPNGYINVRLRSGYEFNARSIGRMVELINAY